MNLTAIFQRFVSSFGILTLAIVAMAQDDVKITFETRATATPKVLKKLSDIAKTTLEAGPEFNNEPLILSLHDAGLKVVMEKIAGATLGKWIKVPTGFRLTRDVARWRELEARAFNARLTALAEALRLYVDSRKADVSWDSNKIAGLIEKERKEREDLLNEIKKNNPNLGESSVFISKGSSRAATPATPALLDVLSHMSAQTLAQVGPGQRVVYSPTPTRMQRMLPFPATNAINRFVDTHNRLASAVRSGPAQLPNVRVSGGLDLDAKPIASITTKMLVILNRPPDGNGIQVTIKFADANGAIVGSTTAYINPKAVPVAAQERIEVANDTNVSFDAVSMELARAYVNSAGGSGGNHNRVVMRSNDSIFRIGSDSPTPAPPLSARALGSLVDPVGSDPQSTFVSDGVLAIAAATNLNLVASLPDTAILPLARSSTSDAKASAILQKLMDAGVAVTSGDGWIVAVPQDRLATETNQMDRVAAARLFGPVLKKGYARLSELAKFSLSLGPVPRLSNFGVTALKLLDPFVADVLQTGMEEHPALFQFLATLDPQVFEALQPEVTMTVGQMTAAQKTLMERVAYGGDGFGSIIGEGDFVGISISDGPGDNQVPKGPSLEDEPTEAMPNGLPVRGGITLRFRPEDMVKAVVIGQRGGQFLTATGLGGYQAFQGNQSIPELSSKLTAFDGFIEAQGFEIVLTREFVKGKSKDSSFADAWLKSGSIAVGFDGLSAQFKDAVAKAKAGMAQNNIRIGQRDVPPR